MRRKNKLAVITSLALVLAMVSLVIWLGVRPSAAPDEPTSSGTITSTQKKLPPKPASSEPSTADLPNKFGLVPPVADFRARITKKFFGTYVSPGNSPVSPERFQGYHTGVDVEYGDVAGDVPVVAIADGIVIYSSWVSGYGGVMILRHEIDGAKRSVLYGHLRPSSMLAVGARVAEGQQIGLLGTAFSREIDSERRHLHFDILKTNGINLKGYVPTQSDLSSWLNPFDFYPI